MAKKKNQTFDGTPADALAYAIMAYNAQGFIRSGEGYSKYDDNGNFVTSVSDNKTVVMKHLVDKTVCPEDIKTEAVEIMDKFNGKFMLKKLTGGLSSFENSVAKAFAEEELSKFNIAVIASIPHMNEVDKKRAAVEARIEEVRFESEFFGALRNRYDITVDVVDVKFIQSSGIYMITTLYNNKDIIKFWWRDQPDISDIIDGKTINIRGTVNKHEKSKYTKANETMMNRVKITK